MQKFLIENHLTLEDMAGCNYCTKEKNNCNQLNCAKYHFQFHFYLKWYKWIRKMIKLNNLDVKDLRKLLGLSETEWNEFISGHINPYCYKDYNYLDDILYHMGNIPEDINNMNVKKKFLMRYWIKILSYIAVE